MKRIAAVLLMGLLPFFSFSQDTLRTMHDTAHSQAISAKGGDKTSPDTVLLNTGNIIVGHVTDTSAGTVFVEKLDKKHKKLEIDREEVFSIKYGNSGKEVINYIYDTLTGHDLSVDEARAFIQGEQDAQNGFHAIGISVAAFTIGLSSGVFLGEFISFGPPFFFAGIMTYPTVHVRRKKVKDLKIATTDPYLFGYDMRARSKRTVHSFLWGGIGLTLGLVLHQVFENQLNNL